VREKTVIPVPVELPEKADEGALAGHTFHPAEYPLDDLIVTKHARIGQTCCTQNCSDHEPFGQINGLYPRLEPVTGKS